MRIQPDKFSTFSLSNCSEGEKICQILATALDAVDPYEAVFRHVHLNESDLEVNHQHYDLKKINRIFLVGAGKASLPMAEAVICILGKRISAGCIITKQGYAKSTASMSPLIHVIEANHPIPDFRGVNGTKEIIKLLNGTQSNDLIICVISGGGSALLTAPKVGITLQDMQQITSQLLACGASIDEINTIRKHIDQIKGGGLVSQATFTNWITLILSDVIGDPLDRIASGPTVPDESIYADAYEIISNYGLINQIPDSIKMIIEHGIIGKEKETLKPGNPFFSKVNNLIIGNNALASDKAAEMALKLGFNTMVLSNFLQGEASETGKFMASIAQQIHQSNSPLKIPACLIAGGETTVFLHGNGLGGRNQELALGAVEILSGLENTLMVSLATDGGDGPTDAAGAVVTGETLTRSRKMGLHPRKFLDDNDSFHYFKALDDLLMTGPTLTNVGDLVFLFSF